KPPLLTLAKKREILSRIANVDLLDCLDESGAFDLARARQVLAGGTVQQLIVDEVTRTDRQGNTTTRRRIRVRVVDKVRAIKQDDACEAIARRQQAEDQANAQARQHAEREARIREAAYRQEKDIEAAVASRVHQAVHNTLRYQGSGERLPG